MIVPSIDLMDRKAVQLRQGKEKILERENVMELARKFSKYGEIAVVDLDSAFKKGDNLKLIKQICKNYGCRVGGGIRTLGKARKILGFGAKKIIIGTKASPGFLKELPKERLIVAIDSKDGFVVDKGWKNKTKKTPFEVIRETEDYCSEFLFTDVDKEGMMKGVNLELAKKIRDFTKNKVTFAGSITTKEDIKKLENLEINSQIGMALYTGKIELAETFISMLDFEKNKGLIPTVVQDDKKQVLMLAFSTKESIIEAFKTEKGVYYSRSRKKIWQKGETSGNLQELIKARYDCDKDTLLFTVRQRNNACHSNQYSCFGEKEFCLEDLYETILDRLNNPKKGSYTSKILKDEKLIKEKIKEECNEVLSYKDKENLIWEIADLTYFIISLMVKKSISLADIKNELWRRKR